VETGGKSYRKLWRKLWKAGGKLGRKLLERWVNAPGGGKAVEKPWGKAAVKKKRCGKTNRETRPRKLPKPTGKTSEETRAEK